jgi:hypothetical protein
LFTTPRSDREPGALVRFMEGVGEPCCYASLAMSVAASTTTATKIANTDCPR